jgi:putative hemolysin
MGDLLRSLVWGAKSEQYCVIKGGSLYLQLEQDKASCTVCGMKTLERWEIKQESEGDKELVDTN